MATMPPNLENVPREIRNNILEQLLLEQKEVYPYGYPAGCQCSHCHIKAPDLSIMRVNKTLNAEATEVLYSNCTFIMTSGFQFAMFFDRKTSGCMHAPPSSDDMYQSRHMIKKLVVDIIPEIAPPSQHLSRVKHMWTDHDFKNRGLNHRKREIHELDCSVNMLAWDNNINIIKNLRGLAHITIDIEGLFCPHGCCRMTPRVCRVFRALKFKKGLRFAIKGQICTSENERCAASIEHGNDVTAFYDARDSFDVPDDESSVGDEDEDEDGDEDDDMDDDEEDWDTDDLSEMEVDLTRSSGAYGGESGDSEDESGGSEDEVE